MSNSSPSPQTDQQEQTNHESDAISKASLSLNQETLNHPDSPPSKPDQPPPPPLEPVHNSPEEEEEEEGQDQETPAMDPPITAHNVINASPSPGPNTRTNAAGYRKKGKGKGKPNAKKQQAIKEKMQSLMVKLKPIPFKPGKIPDFSKHEKLLKKLGLWDFFHIDFDRNIRVDLIAQLIASYDPKKRASKVENYCIMVSRADFARAFKLKQLRRKKGNNNVGGVVDVDSECESLSDDSIGFVRVLVDEWVLLHPEDDTWMMPKEVAVLYKVIKDGHPEKVDWGSLFWLMVEKELKQGGQLRDCYYASHLQHLIKFQREGLFSDVKEEICDDATKAPDEEGVLMEGPSMELTLGQDSVKEEEKGRGIIIKGDEHETEEQGQWLLNDQNGLGEHFMQRCSSRNIELFESFEEQKREDDDGNKFHVFPSDDTLEGAADGFTGNLLQAKEPNQMSFDHHHREDDQLFKQLSIDIGSIPPFFTNTGKRVIKHDSNDSNKKLRIDDSWDHINNNNYNNKQLDFEMCFEQMQNITERAKMLYEEKEQALQHSHMNQQILLSELQKRAEVIEQLDKTKVEEIQEKNGKIYRLERELCLMESLLEGYKKAVKETQRVFSEYREKARVEEEPTYKDTGLGGLMLTGAEIEKLRKKQEEYKMCQLVDEQILKEFEDDCFGRLNKCAEKVNSLEKRLTGFEDDFKGIVELYEERKMKIIGEEVVDDEGGEKENEKEEEKPLVNQRSEEKIDGGVEED